MNGSLRRIQAVVTTALIMWACWLISGVIVPSIDPLSRFFWFFALVIIIIFIFANLDAI